VKIEYTGEGARPPTPDYKGILINLIAGLSLSENQGDIVEDCLKALSMTEIIVPATIADLDELAKYLAVHHDATNLWGGWVMDPDELEETQQELGKR
jgi:hypothetical protein